MDRTDEPPRPRPAARWVANVVVRNPLLDAVTRAASLRPASIRRMNAVAAALTPGEAVFVDDGYRLFSMPFDVRHRECEQAVPAASARDAIEAVRRRLRERG